MDDLPLPIRDLIVHQAEVGFRDVDSLPRVGTKYAYRRGCQWAMCTKIPTIMEKVTDFGADHEP
jgi:hypothetical protein